MKKNWFSYLLWVFTTIFVAAIFLLPETVPVHWNMQGVVDRYGSRYEYLFISLLPLIIYYGMDFTKKIDPKYENIKKKEDIYEFFKVLMTLLFMVITIVLYFMSFELVKINSTLLIALIMGVMFIALGNYMPKVPQNYYLGIKTPWALENEEVWRKTHRMGGHIFVLVGVCSCICALVNSSIGLTVVVAMTLALIVFLYVYSYMVFKKLGKEE